MTVAQTSQVTIEVIRTNDDVKAQLSRIANETIRAATPSVRVSQASIEVIRIEESAANLSQAAIEVISSEKTLSASFPISLNQTADLQKGLTLGATFEVTATQTARIELGTELHGFNAIIQMSQTAALLAESPLSATMPISLTMQGAIQKGIELRETMNISVNMRANLKVHPEPANVSAFFLLF